MFDHILCYPHVDERPAGPVDAEGKPRNDPVWTDERGRTWMPVSCIINEAVHERRADGSYAVITPAVHAPGNWIVVRARERDAALEADPRCLLVSDSRLAVRGEPFVLICKLSPTTPLGRISPTFAGDRYPFPAGPASGLAPLMVAPANPAGT